MVDGIGGGEGQSNDGVGLPSGDNADTFLKRFRILEKIGEGSYSEVVKCKNRESGCFVACKRLKRLYKSWNQVNDISEVTTLRTLTRHPHILQMLEIHYDVRLGKVSLVFEIMDMNLYELIKDRKKLLPETTVRLYMFQLLKALRHLHKYGVFHRDIKPENILIRSKSHVLKLADLGSVRGIYSQPPFTEYISTRWYRSPECLLTAGQYGFKMDIWAAGCVFYEILTLQPLFPGSSEIDQISRIHIVMGPPPQKTLQKFSRYVETDKTVCRTRNQQNRWDAMLKVVNELTKNPKYEEGKSKNFDWNPPTNDTKEKAGLERKLPSYISAGARDLVRQMLTYDPDGRPSSQRIMNHPYFNDVRDFKIPDSEVVKSPIIAVCGDEYGRTMISYYYGHVDLKTLGDKKAPQRVKMQFSSVKQESASASVSRTSSPLLRGAMSPETPERIKKLEIRKPTIPVLRSSQDSKHKLKITPTQHESPPKKTLKTDKSHVMEGPSVSGNRILRALESQESKIVNKPTTQELPDYIKKSLIADAFAARREHLEAVRSKATKAQEKILKGLTLNPANSVTKTAAHLSPDWANNNNNTNNTVETRSRLRPKYVGATVHRSGLPLPENTSTTVPKDTRVVVGISASGNHQLVAESLAAKTENIKREYDLAKKSLIAEALAVKSDHLEERTKNKAVADNYQATQNAMNASISAATAAVRLGLSLSPTTSDWSYNNNNNTVANPSPSQVYSSELPVNKATIISKETKVLGSIPSENNNQRSVRKSLIAVRNKAGPAEGGNIGAKTKGAGTSNRPTHIPSAAAVRLGLRLPPSLMAEALNASATLAARRSRLERGVNNAINKGSNKWGISNQSNGASPSKAVSGAGKGSWLGTSHPPSLISEALVVSARKNQLLDGDSRTKGKSKKEDSVVKNQYTSSKLKQDMDSKTHEMSKPLDKPNRMMLKAKDQRTAMLQNAVKNPSKTSKIPTRLNIPPIAAGTTNSDWNSNNIYSVTTASKPPLPAKYFGATVHRSELPDNKSTNVAKETRIAQILENAAAAAKHNRQKEQNGSIAPKTFGVFDETEAVKRRTDRIRAQLRDEVYCSSDDDIVSSMRHKLDILISERARRASDTGYDTAQNVEEDDGNCENRTISLRPRRLPKKDPMAINNSIEMNLPSFSLAPKTNNVHSYSVADVRGGSQYGAAAAAYFENRQKQMRGPALLGELPKRISKQN